MAIEKKVENEYGAEFTYHKLREVRVINDDRIGVQVVLTVQSWIDKKARIEGKQPTVRQCIISNADFAMTPFYALLKAKFDEFSHGLDDYDNEFKEVVVNGRKATPAAASFTVQTAGGQLMRRWSEKPEVEEEAPEETAEAKPEVVNAEDAGIILKKDEAEKTEGDKKAEEDKKAVSEEKAEDGDSVKDAKEEK